MKKTNIMSEPKQIIVMRTDLGMRKGKMIAQGAHASMMFLVKMIWPIWSGIKNLPHISKAISDWLNGRFTKVCLQVGSEEELMEIAEKAKEAGLEVHVITDSGKTEFHGVPTKTCLAIGPDYPEKIDPVTGHLKLL